MSSSDYESGYVMWGLPCGVPQSLFRIRLYRLCAARRRLFVQSINSQRLTVCFHQLYQLNK